MNVSNIVKRGLGYEIELSKTVKLLGFFSFIIKLSSSAQSKAVSIAKIIVQ